jgi:orotidine-5'-phosphate decarboxylase
MHKPAEARDAFPIPAGFAASDRVIVALDVDDMAEATRIVDRLGDTCTFYKVGPRLFYREGPACVTLLRERGKKVFLDLKIHDVPSVVAAATRQAASLDVTFLSAHVADGSAAAAAKAAADWESKRSSRPFVVGVTVLTSSDVEDVSRYDPGTSLGDLLEARCRAALDGGCDAVVASVADLKRVRRAVGTSLFVVCPGIRPSSLPSGIPGDDQKRTATPTDAAKEGASFIVVGRPIVESRDPKSAFAAIAESFLSSQ